MTPENLARYVREDVIENGVTRYEQSLALPANQIRDEVWQKIAAGYRAMSDDQRGALLLIARQAMIDTASGILGILDGSVILRDHREEFELFYGAEHEKLNGELQDELLAQLEDEQSR